MIFLHFSTSDSKGMKQEPIELTATVARRAEPRTAARIIRRAPFGPRPPVKRRLFAVGGASQPGRVRLTVGAVTSSSAPTASPDLPAPDTDPAPLVLRTQRPPKTFQRFRRKTSSRSYPSHSTVWLKVGDKEVLDYKIPMGHQQEVMASELCDLDTKQTVLVRSAFENPSMTNTNYNNYDCSDIDWQQNYSQCYTPPGHNTQTMPQFPTAPVTPEQGGDYKRPMQCLASQPPLLPHAAVPQACRPDGDASSLMWLLDYRLDHLLEPTQDQSPHAPPPSQPPQPQQPAARTRVEQQPPSQPPPEPLQLDNFATCCQRALDYDCAVRKCDHDYKASQEMIKQQGYFVNSTSKPPFTYTELIEQAMLEEGELTVSGIYKWITRHFGFYKSCDDRWKNSVRHNLSMNPYFRKGDKAKGGSGHLWMLANVEGRRVRRNSVAARMGRPSRKVSGEPEYDLCDTDDIPSPANDIWLSSAAENKENMPITGEYSIEYLDYVPDQMLQAAPPTSFTLEESADRILSGTNSHVEVQFITPIRQDRGMAQDVMLVDYPSLDVAMQS